MNQISDNQKFISEQVERIIRSGKLGRSPVYSKLLKYLANATINNTTVSEFSIATDVFFKSEDFDVANDSTVRVYIHNLRRKLDDYYDSIGHDDKLRINIPKGEYRLQIDSIETLTLSSENSSGSAFKNSKPQFFYGGIFSLIAILVIIFLGASENRNLSNDQIALWGEILTDDKPVMILVGDYYIFAEEFADGRQRLVREFDINSPADLRRKFEREDFDEGIYQYDLGLTYLPAGSAQAISSVNSLFAQAGKTPTILTMSEFNTNLFRTHHIVYLGYLSALNLLENALFASSRFQISDNYDRIEDQETSRIYSSSSINSENDQTFVDYGILARFPINDSTQVLIVAGTRDAGLMQISEQISRTEIEDVEEKTAGLSSAFTALYEVYGVNMTNLDSTLIGSERRETENFWQQNIQP